MESGQMNDRAESGGPPAERPAYQPAGSFELTPEMKREITRAVLELLERHGLIGRAASRRADDPED